MTHEEQRIWLINELQKEDNQLSNYPIPNDEQGQKDLLRALMVSAKYFSGIAFPCYLC